MFSGNRPHISLFMSYIGGGGAERVMFNLARGFTNHGLKVDFVLSKAWGPHLSKVPPDVRLVDLGSLHGIQSINALIQYLKETRPMALLSALHFANEIALISKQLSNIRTKVFVTEHNTLSQATRSDQKLKKHLIPKLARMLYPLADGIISVSHGAAADLSKLTGLSLKHIQTIYNPILSTEIFEASIIPNDHPWFEKGEPPVILGVGKLELQKDFATLIKAFALVKKIRDSRLLILGWGPERANLEKMVNELDLQNDVALPGYVDNPYSYMARSSVFALSSAWEGLPTVLVEALALGTPVISTDCANGPFEILRGGKYGTLVPVGNSYLFAEGILNILSGKVPTFERSWLEQFTIETSTNNYLSLMSIS
jgi:glycosyltransferase involved in cell wall biosynthesis